MSEIISPKSSLARHVGGTTLRRLALCAGLGSLVALSPAARAQFIPTLDDGAQVFIEDIYGGKNRGRLMSASPPAEASDCRLHGKLGTNCRDLILEPAAVEGGSRSRWTLTQAEDGTYFVQEVHSEISSEPNRRLYWTRKGDDCQNAKKYRDCANLALIANLDDRYAQSKWRLSRTGDGETFFIDDAWNGGGKPHGGRMYWTRALNDCQRFNPTDSFASECANPFLLAKDDPRGTGDPVRWKLVIASEAWEQSRETWRPVSLDTSRGGRLQDGEKCTLGLSEPGCMNYWKWNDLFKNKLNMSDREITWVSRLSANFGALPSAEGRYVYVFKKSSAGDFDEIVLRHSDEDPDNAGFRYEANCVAKKVGKQSDCKRTSRKEGSYVPVKHTQLNGGWGDVWCAGELRIENGAVCLVNNSSGHFKPPPSCAGKVVVSLALWKMPVSDSVVRGAHEIYKANRPCPSEGNG